MEQRSSAKLEHKSDILTNLVCLEEGRSVKLSQEKEARLQKLFSEREDHLRKKIEKYGGEMVSQFSPLVYQPDSKHLFGGSRDRTISYRWENTP